jgi:hypothetical protein
MLAASRYTPYPGLRKRKVCERFSGFWSLGSTANSIDRQSVSFVCLPAIRVCSMSPVKDKGQITDDGRRC